MPRVPLSLLYSLDFSDHPSWAKSDKSIELPSSNQPPGPTAHWPLRPHSSSQRRDARAHPLHPQYDWPNNRTAYARPRAAVNHLKTRERSLPPRPSYPHRTRLYCWTSVCVSYTPRMQCWTSVRVSFTPRVQPYSVASRGRVIQRLS